MTCELLYVFDFYDRPLSGLLKINSDVFLFLTPFNERDDDYEVFILIYPVIGLKIDLSVFGSSTKEPLPDRQIAQFAKLTVRVLEKGIVGKKVHLAYKRISPGRSKESFRVELTE